MTTARAARAGVLALMALAGLAAGCGGPAPVTRVLLVTLDTTRADRLGCYGYADARTPALDALAGEGVLFEQAMSPAPTTLPSHASIFTGLYPPDHGVRYNIFYRLNDSAHTLAEALREAGFATAGFPASQIVAERFGLRQGFDEWHEPPAPRRSGDDDHSIAPLRPAGEGVDLALDWFARQGGQRSFAWLHLYDPHWPYAPPFPFSASHRERPYDGEIAYADAELGRLLARLREDGGWGRTLVIIAGDHGEGLYQHDERYHSTLIYETTQRVPLIVRAPGVAPRRVGEPVNLVDLMPTILDLARVAAPAVRGVSLRPALEGETLPRRDLYAETLTGAINYGWAELYGVRFGRWKLIDSASPELYDLEADPRETSNLASLEPERVQELRQALLRVEVPLGGAVDPEAARVTLDPETEAMLSSLGYVAGGATSSRAGDAPHPRERIYLEAELLAAQSALGRREFERVEEVCRYVLERDAGNVWAHTSLVTALLGLGRGREATAMAARLIEVNPDGEQSWVLRATAEHSVGNLGAAHEALVAGLRRVPGSERLSYLRLVAEFDLGLSGLCDDRVDATAADHPKSGRLRMLVARCRAREGDEDGALDALREAVDLGFRELAGLEQAEDFESVAKATRFRELKQQVEATRSQAEPDQG